MATETAEGAGRSSRCWIQRTALVGTHVICRLQLLVIDRPIVTDCVIADSQLVALKSRPGEIGVLWEALSPDMWFIGEMRLQWLPA